MVAVVVDSSGTTEAALRRGLRDAVVEHLAPGTDPIVGEIEMPRTGYSAQTVLFDVTWPGGDARDDATYVARIAPVGSTMFPKADFGTHFSVLQALRDAPIATPTPLWFGAAADSPFGRPYFVMERIAGDVPPENPVYTRSGWVADLSAHDQRSVYVNAVRAMVDVNSLDWRSLDLSCLPGVAGGVGMRHELDRFGAYVEWVDVREGDPARILRAARERLSAECPDHADVCLNWGDPKLSNIVYDGVRPVGLLDWEIATVAPPENDLAFFLTYHDSITRAQGHPSLPGFLDDRETIELYQQLSGRDVDDLGWYRLWHLYRLAVMAFRLSQLLVESGRLPSGSSRLPHRVPFVLLEDALTLDAYA